MADIALIRNNTTIASQVAVQLARLKQEEQGKQGVLVSFSSSCFRDYFGCYFTRVLMIAVLAVSHLSFFFGISRSSISVSMYDLAFVLPLLHPLLSCFLPT